MLKKVLWHPNAPILASASYDNAIRLYKEEGDDWECFDSLLGHSSTVWGMDFNKTGDSLVSCSDDRTLRIWSQGQNKKWTCVSCVFGFHGRAIYDVAWSRNGMIASACGDNAVRIFQQEGSSVILAHIEKSAHAGDVNSVAWKGSMLASCGDDELVKIWSLQV